MNAPASCAILGLGYLGRPLAETLWQHGSRVAAWKKTLTSDDIALPIELATGDIAAQNGFQTAFARWQGIETWVCLLPPSAFAHTPEAYPAAVRTWAQAAAHYGANHLIFTSSISVFGRHMGECREHTPPEPDPQNTVARRLIEAPYSPPPSPTPTSSASAASTAPNATPCFPSLPNKAAPTPANRPTCSTAAAPQPPCFRRPAPPADTACATSSKPRTRANNSSTPNRPLASAYPRPRSHQAQPAAAPSQPCIPNFLIYWPQTHNT